MLFILAGITIAVLGLVAGGLGIVCGEVVFRVLERITR